MDRGSVLKAAFMGGLLSGVVSALPFLSLLNLACCGWGIAGGFFAAWVLHSDSGGRAGWVRSAIAGWLAGVVAGVTCILVQVLLTRLIYPDLDQAIEQITATLKPLGTSPEEMEEAARALLELRPSLLTAVMLGGVAALFSFFSLLGGLMGSAVLGRSPGGASPPSSPGAAAPPVPPPTHGSMAYGAPASAPVEPGTADGGAAGDPQVGPPASLEGPVSPEDLPELPPPPNGDAPSPPPARGPDEPGDAQR